MRSYGNNQAEDTVTKTVLLLVAVALNILELFIPRIPFLPWLKPGLANSITIIWMIRFGTLDALLFTFIRVWISSFYFGLSLVTITLALSGGIAATLAMGGLWHLQRSLPKLHTGTIGMAVTGALMHNVGQLCAVYLLLARNSAIVYQLPAMGIASLIFGGFTGVLTPVLWNLLIGNDDTVVPAELANHAATAKLSSGRTVMLLFCGGLAVSLLFIHEPVFLGILAAAATITAAVITRPIRKAILYPFNFWFLFLFIALFNLLFSYGTRIEALPFITVEGSINTAVHSLRLWAWIEISLILQALHVNRFFYHVLKRIFPHRATSLAAALYALEYFPDVISFAKSAEARDGLPWRTPAVALHQFADRVKRFIIGRLGNGGERSEG